jgi:O-methyltransferase/8-demethyl-8-(2,3-dimethoxy-alpha-L-rhamnosyl)tetracenomycin-C 4'-O-methyltransferase
MPAPLESGNRDAYIELLKRSITNYLYLGEDLSFEQFRWGIHYDLEAGQWKIDPVSRPTSLLGKPQLDLIEKAVLSIEERKVPGDFIEAGVWRGGVVILLRALIEAYGLAGRSVFAADSFAGIPKNTRAVGDPVDEWSDRWVASLAEVQHNIHRFGLLDERVAFVVGFFEESLKHLGGKRFALIRLDSDSYDSVETSLRHLYPLLSKGGVVIIDDWHLPGCRQAVADYRERHGITEQMQAFEGNAFWTKRQVYGEPKAG